MRLADIQALFWRALSGEQPEVDAVFRGTAELPARARVQIYTDMVLWRQIDVLREDFPKLAKLLGDDEFATLAEAYVRRWPSEFPSLVRLGRKLAEFIRSCEDGTRRPDLADLAALEWARAEIFEEADALPVDPDALRVHPNFAAARLELIPALRRLTLEYDAAALWRALEDGEAAPEPEHATTCVVAWRPSGPEDWQPLHTTVEADEAQALALAANGAPLGAVCEAFAGRAQPAEAAFNALSSWLAEGWVAHVHAT
jgi:hypothetical protein